MDNLREEIRAILREEIAALTATPSAPAAPAVETVRIASGTDLTRFAREIVERASDPSFAARLARGELRFDLARTTTHLPAPITTGPAGAQADVLAKPLITERDIAALAEARALRIGRTSRLTPLARDEARRRGIRIERSET